MSNQIDNHLIETLIDVSKSAILSSTQVSEHVKQMSEEVKELAKQTNRLAVAEETRLIRDEVQKKWNEKQEVYNEKNDKKWEESTPILFNAKKSHENKSKLIVGAVGTVIALFLGTFLSFK